MCLWFCLFNAHLHALRTVPGKGTYASQYDQSHSKEAYSGYRDEYEPYSPGAFVGGEYHVKVRPAPSTAEQPYGAKPSQYDRSHRTDPGRPTSGQYEPYTAGSARGAAYDRRSGPFDRDKPSQFDREHMSGVQRPEGDQYRGFHPGSTGVAPGSPRNQQPGSTFDRRSGPLDRNKPSQFDREHMSGTQRPGGDQYRGYLPGSAGMAPGSPRSRQQAEQLDKANQEGRDRAFGGKYQGYAPGSSAAQYQNRKGPSGLHASHLHGFNFLF